MENAELDVALEELESRLERLRALYEQYFMGIERIEPAIPRKDIDRRIYVLRREKIRNTAKRFKLQTIISRYNTFQQYWQRICREIEAGTYKRHVIKAERIAPGKMLTIAARKRLGRHAFDEIEAEPAPPAAPAQSALSPTVAEARPASSIPAPPSVPRPTPGATALSAKGVPPAKPAPPPKPGVRPAKPVAAPPPQPTLAGAKPFESLDLDMDFMGDWDPTPAPAKPVLAKPTSAVAPARPFGEALARPLGAAPVKPAPRAPMAAPAAASVAPAKAPAPNAAPRPAPIRPAPPARPAAAPGLPAPAKPVGAAVAPTPNSPRPDPPAAPVATAQPAPLAPAAKLGAAPVAKAIKPATAATAALTDARVRELHTRLVEAKRETKDPGAVSLEGLAKSLKATEAKLREQHKDRKIDFDVVIKDGKAILKPTVR